MASARMRLEWNQTAELWALIAEQQRDPKKRPEPYSAADIHPMLRAKRQHEAEYDDADWQLFGRITENTSMPVRTIDLTKLKFAK